MEAHQRTEFGRGGVVTAAGVRPLYAAEMHYFRTAPSEWQAALASLAACGFTAVSTIVPWNLHEERVGRYRFSGDLDLGRFVDLAAAAGLMVIAKPGPQCGGEVNFFGVPERVLASARNLAVTSRATPAWLPIPPRMFPLPSQAARGYIAEARDWLGEVGRVLARAQDPDGPLVAIALDNHLCGFYRSGAYDIDYHPDALEWWAEHSGDAEPPRRFLAEDADLCARWVEFKEVYIARAMTWIGEALDDAGLDRVARYHNAPPVPPANVNALRVAGRTASLPAWDIYQLTSRFDHMREIGRYLAGSAPLAFASSLGCGAPAYLPPPEPATQCSAAIATLGAGVRAFSVSMAVARDRWTGAASELNDNWVAALVAALVRLDWAHLTLEAQVAVVETRSDQRYGLASSTLGPVTSQLAAVLDMGPGDFSEFGRDEGARITGRWQRAIRRALDAFEIPFVIIDEAAPLEAFSAKQLIICPTHERIDEGLWAKLAALAGTEARIILGPGRPTRGAFGDPLRDSELLPGMGLLRPESLGSIDTLGADLLAALGAELGDDWIAPGSEALAATVHRDAAGKVRALVLCNSGEGHRAELAVPAGTSARDVISGETFSCGKGDVLIIEMAAKSSRLLEVD